MKLQAVGSGHNQHTCFLLYAIPGYGKTQLIGTGKNVLIIRPPQDHTVSIRNPAERNIREAIIRSWDDMDKLFLMAANGEFDAFDWVWLDSISLAQDQLLDGLHEADMASNPKMKGRMPDKGTYGVNMSRLSSWVRGMAGMGTFNFGVTAHPFWGKNLDDDELLMPYVQGKSMPEKICGSMNMVGYLDIKKIKAKGETKAKERRVLYFNGTDRYYAKDQFDAFPNGKLVDPTMPAIEKAIKAARARDAAVTKPKRATTKTTTTRRKARSN